jgi:hypothetical protein
MTRAHTTLTLDGTNQQAAPAIAEAPAGNKTFHFKSLYDYIRANMSLYDGLQGSATHSRALWFNRSAHWIVVLDHLSSSQPRDAHPNSSIVLHSTTGAAVVQGVSPATGQPTDARLALVPDTRAHALWQAAVVRGQNRTETGKAGSPAPTMAPGLPLPSSTSPATATTGRSLDGSCTLRHRPPRALSAAGALALRVVSFDSGVATDQVNVGQGSTTLAVPLAV